MKKEKTLKEKIAEYAAVASAFLAMHENADAQIMYNDVNPDAILSGYPNQYYSLDLNKDGFDDLEFRHDINSWGTINNYSHTSFYEIINSVRGLNDNKVARSNLNLLPDQLQDSTPIDQTLNFMKSGVIMSSTNSSSTHNHNHTSRGNWLNEQIGFLGVKLHFSGSSDNYYGWVRVQILDGDLIIYDYGCDTIPNESIFAGETIRQDSLPNVEDEIFLFPNPAKNYLTVNFPKFITGKDCLVKIFDLNGRLLLKINSSQTVKIDLTEFSSSMYILKIDCEEKSYLKKLVVIK